MSEREIRDAIEQACDTLELRARTDPKRKGGRLFFPLMVGAGLMATACDDSDTVSENSPPYGIQTSTYTGTGTGTGSGTGTATGGGGTGGDGATGGVGGSVGGAGGAGGATGGAGGAGGG